MSNKTVRELSDRLDDFIGAAEDAKSFCEYMKTAFGNTDRSSDASWARSDLGSAMRSKVDDGADYLRCFWDGVLRLSEHEDLPDENYFNEILKENNEPFRIDGETILQDIGDLRLAAATDSVTDTQDPITLSNDFVLGEAIGHGAAGVVHRLSKTTSIGKFDLAIKILHPSPLVSAKNFPERFRREISLLNSLQHRAVVQVIQSGHLPDGRAYYVMPIIEGQTLRDATEGITPDETIELFLEICSGVEFMHRNGVFHRDLKPSNIIVRKSDEQPIVLDFGCAFSLDFLDQDTLTEYAVGSLAYMPPEVIRTPKHRTAGHDVYSLGVMLYECIFRSLPAFESYAPLASLLPELQEVDEIIRVATCGESQRLSSVAHLRSRLSEYKRNSSSMF